MVSTRTGLSPRRLREERPTVDEEQPTAAEEQPTAAEEQPTAAESSRRLSHELWATPHTRRYLVMLGMTARRQRPRRQPRAESARPTMPSTIVSVQRPFHA